ncbi:hypothetical protein ACWEOR_27250, partial [Micromonospora chalcea]
MNETELNRLLTRATEEIHPTRPAAAGWERAGRVRRARRAAGAAAVAVVLVGGGTTALLHRSGPPPAAPPRPAVTSASNAPVVQRPPDRLGEAGAGQPGRQAARGHRSIVGRAFVGVRLG